MLVTAMVLYGGGAGPRSHFRERTGLGLSCTKERHRAFSTDDVLHPPLIRAVVQGFKEVYRWFLANEPARSLDRGPVSVCRGRQVRVLLRATDDYMAMLWLLAYATDASRERVADDVTAWLRAEVPSRFGPFPQDIVVGEIHALRQGDVPYWSAATSSRDLWEIHGACARDVASASCLECIERRVARMSESDLALQAWLLESFLGKPAREEASLVNAEAPGAALR